MKNLLSGTFYNFFEKQLLQTSWAHFGKPLKSSTKRDKNYNHPKYNFYRLLIFLTIF